MKRVFLFLVALFFCFNLCCCHPCYSLQSSVRALTSCNYCVKLPLRLPFFPDGKEKVFRAQLLLNYDVDVALHFLQVYVKTFGEHVGFRIFMDSILLSLTRKVKHLETLKSLSWCFQCYNIISSVCTCEFIANGLHPGVAPWCGVFR